MTISNAIKSIERQLGVTPVKSPNSNQYSVIVKGHVLSFCKNGSEDTITCVHTRRVNDESDAMTDYFAGSFWDTINKAIKYGLN